MTTVWVVLGSAWEDTESNDEYCELVTWVSGVFVTEQEARDAIAVALERRRVHDIWQREYNGVLKRLEPKHGTLIVPFQFYYFTAEARAKLESEAKRSIDPEPESERAENFEIVTMELGKWQS